MKHILLYIGLAFFLGACGSSKNFLERSNEDKALLDAVKKLNKTPNHEDALAAVPILYANVQKQHEAKIASYSQSTDLARWDKIIGEYNILQEIYDAILNSSPAFKLVNPENYSTQLMETRDAAAADYYRQANLFMNKSGRENAKKAYSYFKKSDQWVPGFKDAAALMNLAYEDVVVDVVINPVQDNSFFFNSGWGNSGYNYSNEYFQQTLLRELQNENTHNRYAARFYSDWQARRDNIQPDWVIDLRLRNMDIPYPRNTSYRRNLSNKIQIGTDTSGIPVYQTVTAVLNVTRSSFTARADMEVIIRDLETNQNISNRTFRDDFRWQEEYASYSGDSRALSADDWALVNNRGGINSPSREDVLNQLYRKIYPQVKNNIKYTVDW